MNRYTQKPLYYIKMLDSSIEFKRDSLLPMYKKVLRFGRVDGADIQYGSDQSVVSRNHCHLLYDSGKITLTVLHKNNNKTYVNNKEVSNTKVLKNGDIIRLSDEGPRVSFISDDKGYKSAFSQLEIIDVGIALATLLFFFLTSRIIFSY